MLEDFFSSKLIILLAAVPRGSGCQEHHFAWWDNGAHSICGTCQIFANVYLPSILKARAVALS